VRITVGADRFPKETRRFGFRDAAFGYPFFGGIWL